MKFADVANPLMNLEGVRRTDRSENFPERRYHERLIAQQIDTDHLAIRIDFDFRRALMESDAVTFSVPSKYLKHMMVVADFTRGDAAAIEDALDNAWQLQRSAD
jgi:hypothetical protein